MIPPSRFMPRTTRDFPGAAGMLGCILIAWLTMAAVYEPPARSDPNVHQDNEPVPERDPARAVFYQERGVRLVGDGKLEPALDQFRRAAAFDPSNLSVLINIAYVLDKLGRYEEAITQLQEAEKIDPRNSMIFLNWGNSLINMKKYQEALEPLQKRLISTPATSLFMRIWARRSTTSVVTRRPPVSLRKRSNSTQRMSPRSSTWRPSGPGLARRRRPSRNMSASSNSTRRTSRLITIVRRFTKKSATLTALSR